MKLKKGFFVAVLLSILCMSESGLTEPCGGNNHRKHQRGPYQFITSSWVRAGDGGHYYNTCVENLSDRVLWFDWFVPGPTSYIPQGQSVPSPRFFTDRKSDDFKGCIQYGNHRKPMQEYFIGHEKDREEINREKEQGCDVSRNIFQSQFFENPAKSQMISYSTRIFVASDSKNLENTLMRVGLAVKLEKYDGKTAKISVFPTINSVYETFSGNPKQISVKTDSTILKQAFQKAGFKDAIIPLTEFKENMAVNVPLPQEYTFVNARYGFFDKNNILVGAIFVPVPVPIE